MAATYAVKQGKSGRWHVRATDDDGHSETMSFATEEEAQEWGRDECQMMDDATESDDLFGPEDDED